MRAAAARLRRDPISVFNVLFAVAPLQARRSGRDLLERVSAAVVLLLGTALLKASRLITIEKMTATFLAPFKELEVKGWPAEVEQIARVATFRRTIGESLDRPLLRGFWMAGVFSIRLVVAPRLTRFTTDALAAETVSDSHQVDSKSAE